ncbi:MAG: ankyrin repeat domain-containing protein [Maribacter sp.]|uniref:ankyrin repeat domain-containing protein n=1 Tax=Maribacter sp. TaxID=1897614 RepID=UPI003C793328
MKKTVLIAAGVFMLFCTSATANHQHQLASLHGNYTVVEKVQINPFCKAIVQGDIEVVQKLISLGEEVNRKSMGMTPAIYAARYNKVEILKLLIAHGADLRIKTDSGLTIQTIAESANAKEALEVINREMQS